MKRIKVFLLAFLLLFSSFISHSNGMIKKSEDSIQLIISDNNGETKQYLDIISVSFSEDQTYIKTIMELNNLRLITNTNYHVQWSYENNSYSTLATVTKSGVNYFYSMLQSSQWKSNKTIGEFNQELNRITVLIPKNDIRFSSVGDILTDIHSATWQQEGNPLLPNCPDYAPDCGYGKNYIIGGNSSENTPKMYLIKTDFSYDIISPVNTEEFTISISLPNCYNNQIPLLLDLYNDSTDRISEMKIIPNEQSANQIIQFTIHSIDKNVVNNIHFSCLFLVNDSYFNNIPDRIAYPQNHKWSENLSTWLQSSKAIQSDNFFIKKLAAKVQGDSDNIIQIAHNIVQFTGQRYKMLRFPTHSQDALTVLFTGGICVGVANLAVALFRANNIPARTIQVYNPHSESGHPLVWYLPPKLLDLFFTMRGTYDPGHAACEYYCPGYGWVTADPTWGKTPFQPKSAVFLRINDLKDENEAGNLFSENRGNELSIWCSDKHVEIQSSENGNSAEILTSIHSTIDYKAAAMNISKHVWNKFVSFFGSNLNSDDLMIFQKAVSYQHSACESLMKENLSNFIFNMNQAYRYYQSIKR